jgi:hypothetical protein
VDGFNILRSGEQHHQRDSLLSNHSLLVDWANDDDKPFFEILVQNVGETVSFDRMAKVFSKFGRLNKISLRNGHAYVEYRSALDASLAFEQLNFKSLEGLIIELTPIRHKNAGADSSSSQKRPSESTSSSARNNSHLSQIFSTNESRRSTSKSYKRDGTKRKCEYDHRNQSNSSSESEYCRSAKRRN